jgi:hypothetical protein
MRKIFFLGIFLRTNVAAFVPPPFQISHQKMSDLRGSQDDEGDRVPIKATGIFTTRGNSWANTPITILGEMRLPGKTK